MNELPPFFVTWCRDQDAFHTETLEEMLTHNLENYFEPTGRLPDWIVVGVAQSRKEAFELAETLRAKKHLRIT